jgi:hypothetical protein
VHARGLDFSLSLSLSPSLSLSLSLVNVCRAWVLDARGGPVHETKYLLVRIGQAFAPFFLLLQLLARLFLCVLSSKERALLGSAVCRGQSVQPPEANQPKFRHNITSIVPAHLGLHAPLWTFFSFSLRYAATATARCSSCLPSLQQSRHEHELVHRMSFRKHVQKSLRQCLVSHRQPSVLRGLPYRLKMPPAVASAFLPLSTGGTTGGRTVPCETCTRSSSASLNSFCPVACPQNSPGLPKMFFNSSHTGRTCRTLHIGIRIAHTQEAVSSTPCPVRACGFGWMGWCAGKSSRLTYDQTQPVPQVLSPASPRP